MPTIEFIVQRFNREKDRKSRWEGYQVQTHSGMTVLQALHQIQEEQDATLSWRYSCRMGVCGSCAMVINGVPGLACNTQVLDVSSSRLKLQPLSNFEVIKDLVPDLRSMFEKHAALNTYLVRYGTREMKAKKNELSQSPEELGHYLQFTRCTKCGACMAACPTLAIDKDFLGPMPLTAAYRYNADSRDDGFELRKKKAASLHGVFKCHYAAECSRVCPKGVDPARALQRMKRDLMLDFLKLKPKRAPAAAVSRPAIPTEARKGVPRAPEFTVLLKGS